MATEFIHSTQSITKRAGADLSTSQYRFVKLDANGDVVPFAAATDVPYGLLLNAPKAGFEAHIAITGTVKAEASSAIAIGDYIGGSANGRVAKLTLGTDTTKFVAGRAAKAASAAGIIVQITIDCTAPRTA